MSTHIVGFRPPDERWQEMRAVWDACKQAGVAVPPDVVAFFGGEPPDPSGVEVDLGEAVERWHKEMSEGYQLAIEKLPAEVKYVRFYNSW